MVLLTFGKDAKQSDKSIFVEIVCQLIFIEVFIRSAKVHRFLAYCKEISKKKMVSQCPPIAQVLLFYPTYVNKNKTCSAWSKSMIKTSVWTKDDHQRFF